MGDNLHDDIRSAMEAPSGAKTNSAGPAAIDDAFGSPPSEVLPPVEPDSKEFKPSDSKPQRRPDGTFAPKNGEKATPSKEAQIPLPLGTPAPETPKPDEGQQQFDPAKPPQAWTPAMKEKWGALPEDVRAEITRREQATAYGVQKLMQQYEPMEEIYGAIAQYDPYFQHIQVDPRNYIASMIPMEQTLRLGNPAQKIEMLLALADTYGVPIRQTLDTAMNGKLNELMAQAHQHHKTPPPVPPQIQRELQEARQFREQIEDQAAEMELSQFAQSPEHAYLDHVRDDMANLIEHGYAEGYEDAYELALWRNPELRPVYIQMQQQKAAGQPPTAIQQRQQAAGAVRTPNAAPIQYASDEQSADDDLHDSVRKAWNSAARGGVG